MSDYVAFADRLMESGIIGDPWIEGRPRFRAEPVVVSRAELAELHRAAEDVASAYDEACRLATREPALLDDFFSMTPYQKLMWTASQPMWHGIARADVFRTAGGGIAVCELNSDTPTGEPEATILGEVAARERENGDATTDPNRALKGRFCAMIDAMVRRLMPHVELGAPRAVGLVYPTEMTEDLSLIRLYQAWLEGAGYEVVLGSPFNLTSDDAGGPVLLGTPCALLVRHYKTDWWGERFPVWTDGEPFSDPSPLDAPLGILLGQVAEGRCVVVNPFGAVLSQNKRTMALMWEQMARFSPRSQAIIRAHVPETIRLEAIDIERLAVERDAWVLKSDYGCEGEEVYVGRSTPASEWDECLAKAIPHRWVAQRYFEAAESASGESVNHGVFVIAGEACGLYARIERGMTTHQSLSAPALVCA